MEFVLLVIGLALILAGANFLTDGSSDLARRLRISEFVIGITVIGIGTSAPELVVSIGAALKGSSDMSVGNIIGSNLVNTLVILGITALILPLDLSANNIKKDIPFGVLASVVLLIVCSDSLLGDSYRDSISRSEGLLLLALFIVFLSYTIYSSPAGKKSDSEGLPEKKRSLWLSIAFVAGGLAGLIYGGDLFLDHALIISRRFGISNRL